VEKKPRAVIACIFALAALAASSLALGASDLKISYRTENKALVTSKSTHVEYHSARRMLIKWDGGKKDILVDYVDFATYEIDHKKKVIGKTTQEDRQKAAELMAARLKEGGSMPGMMGWMAWAINTLMGELGDEDADPTVKNAGIERVADRSCEKWAITLKNYSYSVSADPSLALPVPPDALERSRRQRGAALLANPKLGKVLGKFFDAANGVKGVQLRTEAVVPIGPITVRMLREATEVAVGPLPASVFELPKGYSVEDAGKKRLAELEKDLGEKNQKRQKDQKNKK
jgi:hypothetical protein